MYICNRASINDQSTGPRLTGAVITNWFLTFTRVQERTNTQLMSKSNHRSSRFGKSQHVHGKRTQQLTHIPCNLFGRSLTLLASTKYKVNIKMNINSDTSAYHNCMFTIGQTIWTYNTDQTRRLVNFLTRYLRFSCVNALFKSVSTYRVHFSTALGFVMKGFVATPLLWISASFFAHIFTSIMPDISFPWVPPKIATRFASL